MNKITIIFLIVFILEYAYYYFYLSNWKTILGNSINIQEIQFNLDNEDQLRTLMTNLLNERVKMLDTMSYIEWVEYTNKNVLLEFQGRKYYLYIYEKDKEIHRPNVPSSFILRASYQKELLNLDFSDEVKQVNQRYIVLQQFPTNANLIDLMYYMQETINGCNSINYYWEDPFNKRAIEKKAYFKTFKKNENNKTTITGLIGIGYEVEDLDYKYSDITLNYVGIPFVIFVIFMIFLLTNIMYYTINNPSYLRPGVIFIILNAFLLYQISLIGTITDIPLEQSRIAEINSSTLGMSFLVAVNIFIIQSIRTKSNNKMYTNLYSESIFLFAAALIFLLCSMYKQSNYTEVNGLRKRRLQNQIFFNMSIFMNFGIFINYLLFITKRKDIFNINKLFIKFT